MHFSSIVLYSPLVNKYKLLWLNCRIPFHFKATQKNWWMRGYRDTQSLRNTLMSLRIHVSTLIYTYDNIKSIQYVYLSFLKPLKVEKRIKGITANSRIQLFQGYSFEVTGYSAVIRFLRLHECRNNFPRRS